ncbi:MAG: glycosyltransferase family 39 protein [Verrucomicrobiae bacterium]|nr:glycosyltransferase family 39 protein [Verrucomicrobiae bacterium]
MTHGYFSEGTRPENNTAIRQRICGLPSWVWAIAFVACIACAHLAYGLWFWTKSPTNAPKAALSLKGEDFLKSFPGWDTEEERDQAAYNRPAIEILKTGVPRYRTGAFFDHAPVYAYFLAACYWIGGVRLLSVVIPQAVLSGLTGLLLAIAAWRLAPVWRPAAAAIAAFMVLINVRVASFVGTISTLPLTLAIHALAFYLAVSATRPWKYILFALVTVFGVYTTASYFLVGCAAAAWLIWGFMRSRLPAQLIGAGMILVGVITKLALVSVPGDPLREVDKAMFWYGNNPYYESVGWFDLWTVREDPTWTPWLPWQASDAEKARYNDYLQRAGGDKRKAGLLWAWENPMEYVKMCFVRLRATLGPLTGHMRLWQNKLVSTLLWLLVFPAGFFGLWRARRTLHGQLGWFIVLAVCGFETFVIAGLQQRYRLPVDVILIVFAATVYAGLMARMASKLPSFLTTPARNATRPCGGMTA